MAQAWKKSPARVWAEEQGFELRSKGRLPAHVLRAYEEAHPDGDEDLASVPDLEDELELDPEPETFQPDPEPKRGEKTAGFKPPKKTIKVAPATRKDIKAKVALMLTLPAGVFARRDPICGSVLLQQVPDISDALTDIVVDSPDLVQFFTSGGGSYMKWLTLAMAVQPVAEMAFKHHVAHSIEIPAGGGPPTEPDWSMYAAPEYSG